MGLEEEIVRERGRVWREIERLSDELRGEVVNDYHRGYVDALEELRDRLYFKRFEGDE